MIEAMSRDTHHLDMIEEASRVLHEVTHPGEPLPSREATGHEARCPHRVVRPSGMVMVHHACHVKIWMQTSPFNSKFEVHDHDGLDHLLGLLTAYAHAWSDNPSICILPSVSPLPEDAHSNQLRLDYDAATDVGAIACTIDNGQDTGTWFHPRRRDTTRAAIDLGLPQRRRNPVPRRHRGPGRAVAHRDPRVPRSQRRWPYPPASSGSEVPTSAGNHTHHPLRSPPDPEGRTAHDRHDGAFHQRDTEPRPRRRAASARTGTIRPSPVILSPPQHSAENVLFGGRLAYGTGWATHEGAQMTVSAWAIARRLPQQVARAARLAWDADRRALMTVLGCQVGHGVAGALGLLATNSVLTGLLSGPPDAAPGCAQFCRVSAWRRRRRYRREHAELRRNRGNRPAGASGGTPRERHPARARHPRRARGDRDRHVP